MVTENKVDEVYNPLTWIKYYLFDKWRKDKCEICRGSRGGVRGNENIINGKIVCDYCHSDLMEKQ